MNKSIIVKHQGILKFITWTMASYLLHGTLQVTINKAIYLTDKNRHTGRAPRVLRKVVEGIEERIGHGKGESRLYATIALDSCRVGRTHTVQHEPVNPVWDETLRIHCAHEVSNIVINVKEDLSVGSVIIGEANIPVKSIISGAKVDNWYDLYGDSKNKLKGGSKLHVSLVFTCAEKEPSSGLGISKSLEFAGVPFTYFKQHRGCKVTLYQDAHMHDNFLPPINLAFGKVYEPKKCWQDMYDAMYNAKHIIYITGWSVYTEVLMVNSEQSGVTSTSKLGELLKQKAAMGVAVKLLIWDDKTSVLNLKGSNSSTLQKLGLGMMKTRDEETLDYFSNSAVKCRKCPRNPDDAFRKAKGLQVGFSHHQKTVTVDVPVVDSKTSNRRIISFIGGLDLCGGRYDTQDHSLFHTLDTTHKKDFYQPCFPKADLAFGGPREPWHDIHAKIEGPAAWDILDNFEQRWKMQVDTDLYPIKKLKHIESPDSAIVDSEADSWNVQIFRSIDTGSVAGLETTPTEKTQRGLVNGKASLIDKSIQDAYVHAIRHAKNFIYIENQYFIGSSFAWVSHKNAGALNIIPREIALKIVSKIEAGERFAAYIVIPMWPEGDPHSSKMQHILQLQTRTIEMMYKTIAMALEAKQMSGMNPKDYLSFFCLGNRETKIGGEYVAPAVPDPESSYMAAQVNRRFMIYVHSKLMIVDDEYIIVGSANINQRSMDGGRDTEIAMGAYQPSQITSKDRPPRGEVHGFRMALWYEHLGALDEEFLRPHDLKCLRKVNMISDRLWRFFTDSTITNLHGHLLTYPIAIEVDGSVTSLPNFTCFPNTKASITGTRNVFLPEILMT